MRNLVILLFVVSVLGCNQPVEPKVESVRADTIAPLQKPPVDQCPMSDTARLAIQHALSLQVLEDMTDEEAAQWQPCFNDCQGLTSQSFDTTFNDHCILSICRIAEYMGAYPSTGIKYFNFDKTTGQLINADDVFIGSKMKELIKKCKAALKEEVAEARKDTEPADREVFDNCIKLAPEFTVESLSKFSIDREGIVVHYDFEFPHAVRALGPLGDIHLSASELRPYLKPNGVLSFMLQ